jgi:CheY-like chemotaxis protein
MRVLVVDDDEDARELLRALLESRGASVLAATCVADALAQLAQLAQLAHAPDVIVSDIAMPEEDGYTLVRAVRARELGTERRIPVIAVTAYASASDRARALDAGFDLHFAKPVDMDALAIAIGQLHALTPRAH